MSPHKDAVSADTVLTSHQHTPSHRFVAGQAYIVTAATWGRQRIFNTQEELRFLTDLLLERLEERGWDVQAWAVMPNHYHFVGLSPVDNATSLSGLLKDVHSKTAVRVNAGQGKPGRKVWWNYWDTCITFARSYYSRLNYVHHNPVKHGYVKDPEAYPFCSFSWFVSNAASVCREVVLSHKIDKVNVPDDF